MKKDVLGRYRHCKGGEYEVLGIAKDSENLEEVVVYRALYGEKGMWVRPKDMFFGKKEVNGQHVNRFTKID